MIMMQEHKVFELNIPAKLEKLSDVISFLDEHLERHDCPMKVQMQLDIAAEEIFVNIANYAYSDKNGDASIKMSFGRNNDGRPFVSILFSDRGIFFDPLAHVDPDITLSAEERQIGGLGILMAKKYSDDIFYEYKDGHNILTLVKYLD